MAHVALGTVVYVILLEDICSGYQLLVIYTNTKKSRCLRWRLYGTLMARLISGHACHNSSCLLSLSGFWDRQVQTHWATIMRLPSNRLLRRSSAATSQSIGLLLTDRVSNDQLGIQTSNHFFRLHIPTLAMMSAIVDSGHRCEKKGQWYYNVPPGYFAIYHEKR